MHSVVIIQIASNWISWIAIFRYGGAKSGGGRRLFFLISSLIDWLACSGSATANPPLRLSDGIQPDPSTRLKLLRQLNNSPLLLLFFSSLFSPLLGQNLHFRPFNISIPLYICYPPLLIPQIHLVRDWRGFLSLLAHNPR